MAYPHRCGKINVKVLVILIVAVVALGTSLFAARQIHRNIRSKASLLAGETAFANQDWPAAFKSYRNYLVYSPNDVQILRKYGQACLAIRPLDAKALSGAIAAYRRIMEVDRQDATAYEKLAMLYGLFGNYEELAAVARARLEQAPDDLKAPLWLADALIRQNKGPQAAEVLGPFLARMEPLPDRHVEYVRACTKMADIAIARTVGDGKTKPDPNTVGAAKTEALGWLQKAVGHAPESGEALLSRARFYRLTTDIPGIDEKDRPGLARKDLEEADRRGPENPQGCLFLATEWLAQGEYDRTAAVLQAGDKFTTQALQEQFFDLSDWVAARFLLKAEVAMRKGMAADVVALVDQTLTTLTERRHRAQVLPSAVLIYVAAGKAPEARRCLDEYLELVRTQAGSASLSADSTRRLAGLQALVAGAENRPYAVINALAGVAGSDASNAEMWRMLADAYSRTDQTARAVNALNQYRRLNPQDARASLELARQYLRMGDWRKAVEAAGMAESQAPAELAPKVFRIAAAVNLAAGQRGGVDTAALKNLSEELSALRQANPTQVDIRLLQAIIAGYVDKPEEVERRLKLAVAECSDSLRAQIQLAGHYLRTKRVKEAVATCEAACKDHPGIAEPWLSLADVHVTNTDYTAACNCLRQGLTAVTDPREKRSLSIKLAVLEVIHGDQAAGTNILREMAAEDPRAIQPRLLLLGIRSIRDDRAAAEQLIAELKQAEGEGGLWWRAHQASLWLSSPDWRKQQKDIQSLLQFCIDADPAWSAPVLLLTQMYEQLGDVKQVEDTCRQALNANPAAADVASRLLTLLARQGRFADAQRLLGQVAIDPQLVSAWQVRIALGTGDVSRATDELKLRAASDNKDADSRIQLARLVYQQTKDINEALKYLKEAEAITTDSQTLVAVKASILKAEGKTAEALQTLDEYVAAHNDFTAYWMRAVYLAEAGDLERAEKDFRKLTTFAQNSEAGYELLGNFYAGTKRVDAGVAAIEEGLQAHPESLGLKRVLMRQLLARGQGEDQKKAIALLSTLEEQLPPDAELLTIRAAQILQEQTPQAVAAAKAKLEDAVKLEPTAVNAHYTLIGLAMREGDYKAACAYAVQALESNPKNALLVLARARGELAMGYPSMAVRLAREVLQQDPNSVEALGVLVDSALSGKAETANTRSNAGSAPPKGNAAAQGLDLKLLQEVRTLIDAALTRRPNNEMLLLARAHVLSALAQPKEAIGALEAYCQTKEGTGSITALVTLADLYRLAGEADKAKQKIDQAAGVNPASLAVIHARLLWLVSQNRWDELKAISSAYLAAKEQDPAILQSAATILAAANSADLKKEGVKLFEQVVALSPASVDARLGLASNLYQTGDVERAEKMYRELLAQRPDEVRALNDLAWILQEHDRKYDAALDLANKGMKLVSEDDIRLLHLLDTRGTILANLPDRLADARDDFTRLAEKVPADSAEQAKALLSLGRVCVKLNDLAGARQHLQKASQIDQKVNIFTPEERVEIKKTLEQAGAQARQ